MISGTPVCRHNVHPGILYHLGAVFSDLGGRIKPEEIAVGFVEMSHIAVRVRDHGPVVNTVENEFVDLQLVLKFLHR